MNHLKVDCDNGWYELKPFQSYSGVTGRTSNGDLFKAFKGNQQAKQMDDDALSILTKSPALVTGEEGLKDIRVVEAIFESSNNAGKRVNF